MWKDFIYRELSNSVDGKLEGTCLIQGLSMKHFRQTMVYKGVMAQL